MRITLTLMAFTILFNPTFPQEPDLGAFEWHQDIGKVKKAGSVSYNSNNQSYKIKGAGVNMWFGEDQFHYLWKSIKGDFILRARASFKGQGVELHRKMGWMVRQTLSDGSPHVNACVHGDGLTSLQFRRSEGAETEEVRSANQAPDVIQLERSGNRFILSTARFGEPFNIVEVSDVNLPDEVFAGLYVCSHNADVLEEAVFREVRIIRPAGKELVPYRDYLGSLLEVLDADTGEGKVLMTSAHSLQAPNWTPDGRFLIYNSNGFLYRYDLASGGISLLNTGFAVHNNNDHVLSFDGKWLGISHHNTADNGNSTIYMLSSEGSDLPRQVTKSGLGASYLHGWSPDGRYLVFTGQRGGKFGIDRVDLLTGEEVRLTETGSLSDGPEYSPDGEWIYFNSTRSGNMQIWRMKPDGSRPEQLTFDPYNNWFPHISPDGKRMVFLSFDESVPPTDHPFYKQVYIRMMPAHGGEPRIIAYLYGGQGTINVPSWSPDGRRLAFVSNSD